MHVGMENTNQMLKDAKEKIQKEIKELEEKFEGHKQILSELKVHLYAKFGTNINLEADDE